MAGHSSVLAAIRALLAGMDNDALGALANPGLVRRALKDLESTPVELCESETDFAVVRVGSETVRVPAVPAQSRCTCPAGGICRHAIAALLFLRDRVVDDGPAPPGQPISEADSRTGTTTTEATRPVAPDADLLAITDDMLAAWCGRALLRKAHDILADGIRTEFETQPKVIIRFPVQNVAVHWIVQGGLAGMICQCGREICAHKPTAVLAYQIHRGVRSFSTGTVREAASGAARDRDEVRAAAHEALADIVALGLGRFSDARVEQLRSVAAAAHGVDLPRLEGLLHTLANRGAAWLGRAGNLGAASLLELTAEAFVLTQALATPTPALVGRHRGRFQQAGEAHLFGIGAGRWKSGDGTVGLTVYFFSPEGKEFLTWTDARPAGIGYFDPLARFKTYGPWNGCDSPREAAGAHVHLRGIWRTAGGRLSAREGIQATLEGSTPVSGLPWMTNWSELADQARRVFVRPFRESSEGDRLVLLKPHRWGTPGFDPVRQQVRLPIFDEDGRSIELLFAYSVDYQSAIDYIEKLVPGQCQGVFGQLQVSPDGLSVTPVTLYETGKTVHLTLISKPRRGRTGASRPAAGPTPLPPAAPAPSESSPEETEVAALGPSSSALGRLLQFLQAELEALADLGLRTTRPLETLHSIESRLSHVGLKSCVTEVNRVTTALEATRRQRAESLMQQAAAGLLRAYFLAHLASEQETLSLALDRYS